ncbi:MAG TPA: Sjogren's syndrome/scleroderma autoantigen 1 family protein [Nitrosopumilaceae archaeon]|nr:Sjogren's syndrome/scleroderma autoantigen 1 family protein [Nitrosopumilaceae archaeon]
MSKDLTKKAVEMLLKGATLSSEPCPYCKGVRVMRDGSALCVNCGREAKEENIPIKADKEKTEINTPLAKCEQKLQILTEELEHEKDHQKQQEILKSINELLGIIEKLKK